MDLTASLKKKNLKRGFIHFILSWMEIMWCLNKNWQCRFSCFIHSVCSCFSLDFMHFLIPPEPPETFYCSSVRTYLNKYIISLSPKMQWKKKNICVLEIVAWKTKGCNSVLKYALQLANSWRPSRISHCALIQDTFTHSWWWMMIYSVLITTETLNSGGDRKKPRPI